MKILELFSGTESFSKVARERGHETLTVDNEKKFNPDICMDVNELKPSDLRKDLVPFKPDIIWASPPCQKFSVASIYHHWTEGKPKHNGTWESLQLVAKTISLILALKPEFWIIENPRGMLRKQPMMLNLKRDTVTYCQYGHKVQKPTDLWNNLKHKFKPMCKPGADCHEKASRGAKTGVQGIYSANFHDLNRNPALRAVVPGQLCEEIIRYCEDFTSKMSQSIKSHSEENLKSV